MDTDLHQRLVDLQPTEELARKQKKAMTKHYWTQEDIDFADRRGREIHAKLFPPPDALEAT